MLDQQIVDRAGTTLLCLYHPQQLLPALAAVMQHRELSGQPGNSKAILFIWCSPKTSGAMYARRLSAFQALIKHIPWLELWMPPPSEIAVHLSSRFRTSRKASYFANALNSQDIREIFYAHDLCSDFTPQAMMQAFPMASRICFGDAFGMVYTRKYFDGMLLPLAPIKLFFSSPRTYFQNLIRRAHRAYVLPSPDKILDADCVVSTIIFDPSGDFLEGKRTEQVSLAKLERSLSLQVAGVVSTFGIPETGRPPNKSGEAIVLLGSYSESKLCSLDMEIELYKRSLKNNLSGDSKIILKPHPASTPEKTEMIRSNLEKMYHVTLLDESLHEIPIEAMPFQYNNRVIISYSNSTVSLAAISDAEIVHAMTDDLISDLFFPQAQQWLRESNLQYLQLARTAREMRFHRNISPQ